MRAGPHDHFAIVEADLAADERLKARRHRLEAAAAGQVERRELEEGAHVGHRGQAVALVEVEVLQLHERAERRREAVQLKAAVEDERLEQRRQRVAQREQAWAVAQVEAA